MLISTLDGNVFIKKGRGGLDSSSLSKMLFLVLACCEIRGTMELHRENVLRLLTCEHAE